MKKALAFVLLSSLSLVGLSSCAGSKAFTDDYTYKAYGDTGGEQAYFTVRVQLTANKLTSIGGYDQEINQYSEEVNSVINGAVRGLPETSTREQLEQTAEEYIEAKLAQIGQKTLGRVTADSADVTFATKVGEGSQQALERYVSQNSEFVSGGSAGDKDSEPDGWVSASTNVKNPQVGEAAVRNLLCGYTSKTASCKVDNREGKNSVAVPSFGYPTPPSSSSTD